MPGEWGEEEEGEGRGERGDLWLILILKHSPIPVCGDIRCY